MACPAAVQLDTGKGIVYAVYHALNMTSGMHALSPPVLSLLIARGLPQLLTNLNNLVKAASADHYSALQSSSSPLSSLLSSRTMEERLGVTVALQLKGSDDSPLLMFLSPKQWWGASDPVRDTKACRTRHTVSYLVSWIVSCLLITRLQMQLEFKGVDDIEISSRVGTAAKISEFGENTQFIALGAVTFSYLYALTVTYCSGGPGTDGVEGMTCPDKARQRWNYVWPAVMLCMYGFSASMKQQTVSQELSAFVYNFQANSADHLKSWQEADLMAKPGGIKYDEIEPEDLIDRQLALGVPSSWDDMNSYFQIGVVLLVLSITAWFGSCQGFNLVDADNLKA